jgi:hypothetical protein
MSATDSLEALRRANPRHEPGFADRVAAVAVEPITIAVPRHSRVWRPSRVLPALTVVSAVIVAALVVIGSPPSPLTLAHAATISASAADASGVVTVTITQDGATWASKAVQWNGDDIAIDTNDPGRPGHGDMRVVDGALYLADPDTPGRWERAGSPESIDPDSGTTPAEYLAAVKADAGGETLRRISAAMTDTRTTTNDDGSTVYAGRVAAGELARESGYKEGQPIRVFPFGYVAHDDAANPASPVNVAITVNRDGLIREILATWRGASAWTYRLSYSGLGSTPAPPAPPANLTRDILNERGVDG